MNFFSSKPICRICSSASLLTSLRGERRVRPVLSVRRQGKSGFIFDSDAHIQFFSSTFPFVVSRTFLIRNQCCHVPLFNSSMLLPRLELRVTPRLFQRRLRGT